MSETSKKPHRSTRRNKNQAHKTSKSSQKVPNQTNPKSNNQKTPTQNTCLHLEVDSRCWMEGGFLQDPPKHYEFSAALRKPLKGMCSAEIWAVEAWSHKLGKICPTISLLNKAYKHYTFIQHLMSLAGTIEWCLETPWIKPVLLFWSFSPYVAAFKGPVFNGK